MKILIKNCNLISMDSNREQIEYNIDVLLNDNKIAEIGYSLLIGDDYKIINASGQYLLPGFINTHAHIGMSIFRESVDGYTTQDWLTEKIWPIEDKLTPDDIYKSSLLSCIEMIKTGTTTVNDQYFFPDNIAQAVINSGIRCELTRTIMDASGSLDERLKELENFIIKYNNKYDNLYINVGIHGLYTASERCVQKSIELAKKYNLNIHMHYLENSKEYSDILNNQNGKKPFEVLKDNFENTNTILAHCVKLENDDYNIISKYNLKIAHCPISNLKLGCGIANIPEMLENNIVVSLGTDGQGSGCNLDMFDTMKFTGLLQKGINENPKLLPAYEILKMATINGAKALNKENIIGSIEVDKLADLILLDLDNVTQLPINDIFSDIVYNAKGSNVTTTIINGKILMENKRLTELNEKKIIDDCKHIMELRG